MIDVENHERSVLRLHKSKVSKKKDFSLLLLLLLDHHQQQTI